jgi:hypothetical protein
MKSSAHVSACTQGLSAKEAKTIQGARMTDDRRYHKEYCRDYCGYDKCPCVWLLGLGNFHQGTGFTEAVADEIIAALKAADRLKGALEREAALRSALERLENNFNLLLCGKSVRDVAETAAEVTAALSNKEHRLT